VSLLEGGRSGPPRRRLLFTVAVAAAVVAVPVRAWQSPSPAPRATPNVVFETAKGTVEIQLFAADAPKSVEHIVNLVRRHFYRGQRIHRVTPSIVQWGDPQSRKMTYQAYWGSGGSGTPINVNEIGKKHSHVRGAVGLAHSGNPFAADSQIYVMKTPSPGLDGKHAIIGRVVAGMAVVDKLQVTDLIKMDNVK
jgi:peptidyl-prolyl cis-trans isomerase B (cyclophilin B)